MLQETLFNIPYYTIPTLNYKKKKKQLTNLLKSYPEKKQGIQPFSTNRQSNRDGLAQGFSKILNEELDLLAQKVKANIQIKKIIFLIIFLFILHYHFFDIIKRCSSIRFFGIYRVF